MTPANKTDN